MLCSQIFQGTKWNSTLANELMFKQVESPFTREKHAYPVTPSGNFTLGENVSSANYN